MVFVFLFNFTNAIAIIYNNINSIQDWQICWKVKWTSWQLLIGSTVLLYLSGIPNTHHIFCWRNHQQETAISHPEMGRRWGCGSKALGTFCVCSIDIFVLKWRKPYFMQPVFDSIFVCAGKVPGLLPVRQNLQLGWLWLWGAEELWLYFHAMEGTVLAELGFSTCWNESCVTCIFTIAHSLYPSLQEQFLVPDHTIKDISGASFAGFYYICFQKSTATIEGYYYHRSSEW